MSCFSTYLFTYFKSNSKNDNNKTTWKVYKNRLPSLDEALQLHRQIIIGFFLNTFKKMGSVL